MEVYYAFLLLACGDDTKDTGVSEEDAALWEENFRLFGLATIENWTGVNASDSVHGVAMQTWYNDTAYEGLMQGEEAMPNGSIIVKEGYADAEGSDINAITVMKKSMVTTAKRGIGIGLLSMSMVRSILPVL